MKGVFLKKKKKICKLVGIPKDADHEAIYEKFISMITELSQDILTLHIKARISNEELEDIIDEIDEMTGAYLSYNEARVKFICINAMKGKNIPEHPDAEAVKKTAKNYMAKVESSIVAYLICHLEIQSFINEIDQDVKDCPYYTGKDEQLTGAVDTRDLTNRQVVILTRDVALDKYMERLKIIEKHIDKLENACNTMEILITNILNVKDAKNHMMQYMGLLRQKEFTAAREAIDQLLKDEKKAFGKKKKKKITENFKVLTNFINNFVVEHAVELTGREGSLFLRKWELEIAYKMVIDEKNVTKEYIEKYSIPEMRFRQDSLKREKARLLETVTMQEMLETLEALQKKFFLPLKTLQDVRSFEHVELEKSDYFAHDFLIYLEKTDNIAKRLVKAPTATVSSGHVELFSQDTTEKATDMTADKL